MLNLKNEELTKVCGGAIMYNTPNITRNLYLFKKLYIFAANFAASLVR